MSRIYIAGPMTGCKDFNYPAFHAAEVMLRSLGHEVENPAEEPETPPAGWAGWMRLGIAKLIRCDEVCLLPGWRDSRGAKVEADLAETLGMPTRFLVDYLAPVREPKESDQ